VAGTDRFEKLKAAATSPGHEGRAAGQALFSWIRRYQMGLSFVIPAGTVVEIKDVSGPAVTRPLNRKLVIQGDTFRELRRELDGSWKAAFVVPVGLTGERWQVLKVPLQALSVL
jgi:hypothetical protein